MKHVMFVGRWQPVHKGHIALWRAGAWESTDDGVLFEHYPALIYVRDIPPNEHNPFTTEQTMMLLEWALKDCAAAETDPKIVEAILASKVMAGPDISAVRYGRGVGYAVQEVVLPGDVQRISATELRRAIKTGMPGWRDFVTPSVGQTLQEIDW